MKNCNLLSQDSADKFSGLICNIVDYICKQENVPSRTGAVSTTEGHVGSVVLESRSFLDSEYDTHTIRINLNLLQEDSVLRDRFFEQYKLLFKKYDYVSAFLALAAHEAGHVVHYEKSLILLSNINKEEDYLKMFSTDFKITITPDSRFTEMNLPEVYAEYIVFKYFNILNKEFKYELLKLAKELYGLNNTYILKPLSENSSINFIESMHIAGDLRIVTMGNNRIEIINFDSDNKEITVKTLNELPEDCLYYHMGLLMEEIVLYIGIPRYVYNIDDSDKNVNISGKSMFNVVTNSKKSYMRIEGIK